MDEFGIDREALLQTFLAEAEEIFAHMEEVLVAFERTPSTTSCSTPSSATPTRSRAARRWSASTRSRTSPTTSRASSSGSARRRWRSTTRW